MVKAAGPWAGPSRAAHPDTPPPELPADAAQSAERAVNARTEYRRAARQLPGSARAVAALPLGPPLTGCELTPGIATALGPHGSWTGTTKRDTTPPDSKVARAPLSHEGRA